MPSQKLTRLFWRVVKCKECFRCIFGPVSEGGSTLIRNLEVFQWGRGAVQFFSQLPIILWGFHASSLKLNGDNHEEQIKVKDGPRSLKFQCHLKGQRSTVVSSLASYYDKDDFNIR